MKKFIFSLQTLHDLKEKERKNQKRELSKIEARLNMLNNELEALELENATFEREYRECLKGSIEMEKLKQYGFCLKEQAELIDKKKEVIVKQDKVKKICVQKLVAILKEIKSLEKLKEKQYEEYLVESKKEDNQRMDDILSFNTVAK